MKKILKQQPLIVIVFAVIVLAAHIFLKNYYLGILMAFLALFYASFPFKLYLQKKKALAIVSAIFLLVFFVGVFIVANWKAITREYIASAEMKYNKGAWTIRFNVPDYLKAGDYFLELRVKCMHGLESEFCRRDNMGFALGISLLDPNDDYYYYLSFPLFLIERFMPAKLTAIFPITKSLDVNQEEFTFFNGDYLIHLRSAEDFELNHDNFSDHNFTFLFYKKRLNN